MLWIAMSALSAVFAALTSILAKCGIRKTDSDIATALRTGVVLLFSWLMALITNSVEMASSISAKSALFLILSGLSTGVSWICYFKALSMGDVNKVVPIDKCSTIMTILMAVLFLGERDHLAVKLLGAAMLGS